MSFNLYPYIIDESIKKLNIIYFFNLFFFQYVLFYVQLCFHLYLHIESHQTYFKCLYILNINTIYLHRHKLYVLPPKYHLRLLFDLYC